MTYLTFIFCGLIVFGLGVSLASLFARRRALADVPNMRSSHQVVTSRAGGVGILTAWVGGLLAAFAAGLVPLGNPAFWGLVGLTLLAGIAGLIDDRFGLSALVKFLCQVALALGFVVVSGGIDAIALPVMGVVDPGLVGLGLALFWIVGAMNVVNFMDGINGIAGGTMALTLTVLALSLALLGQAPAMVVCLLLAWAVTAFLPQNIVGKNLFMGDCGSQALGFAVAAFALTAGRASPGAGLLLGPLMLMPFIVDTGVTLVRRARRGARLTEAHREHIYQRLAQGGGAGPNGQERRAWPHARIAALYVVLSLVGAGIAALTLSVPGWAVWLPAIGFLAALLGLAGLGLRFTASETSLGKGPRKMPGTDGSPEIPATNSTTSSPPEKPPKTSYRFDDAIAEETPPGRGHRAAE